MLYLAALASFASVLFSRLLIARLGRLHRGVEVPRAAGWIMIWGSLTALCWWTMLQTPPLVAVGAALNIVWYAFEIVMRIAERRARTRP